MKIEIQVTRTGQTPDEKSKLFTCNSAQAKRLIDTYLDTILNAWTGGEIESFKIEVSK